MSVRVMRLKVQGEVDRNNVLVALANNGYSVKVEKEEKLADTDYYIRIEKECQCLKPE